MFEDEIKKILQDQQGNIAAKVVASLQAKITENISWQAEDALTKEVKFFVENEVLPEVRKQLLEKKEEMVALFKDAAIKIGSIIAAEMQTRVVKNLSSWSGKEVLKKLLDD